MSEETDDEEDELADCPMYSVKADNFGEFIGNFDGTKEGIIKHFTSESFYLWMKKTDLNNFEEIMINNELTAQFKFDGKLHQISTLRLKLR